MAGKKQDPNIASTTGFPSTFTVPIEPGVQTGLQSGNTNPNSGPVTFSELHKMNPDPNAHEISYHPKKDLFKEDQAFGKPEGLSKTKTSDTKLDVLSKKEADMIGAQNLQAIEKLDEKTLLEYQQMLEGMISPAQ